MTEENKIKHNKESDAEEKDILKEFEMSEDADEKSEEKTVLPVLDKKEARNQVAIPLEEETADDDSNSDSAIQRKVEKPKHVPSDPEGPKDKRKDIPERIFALRTTANREDQVMDFVTSNASKKKLKIYSVIRPHGMRGYIFVEAESRAEAEQAAFNVPYARGLLPSPVDYSEIEHMLEQVKKEVNIKKNDVAEIIAGPFKREKCKITRVDKGKEEIVVELLEAAVPIPITLKMDAVKVIRRDSDDLEEEI